MDLCRIEEINELTGEAAENAKAREYIGYEARLCQLENGKPMRLEFEAPLDGVAMETTRVQRIRRDGTELRVATKIYTYVIRMLEAET